MLLDCNKDEHAIANGFENKVVAKSNFNGVEIENSDLEFVISTCNKKSE